MNYLLITMTAAAGGERQSPLGLPRPSYNLAEIKSLVNKYEAFIDYLII